MSILTNKGVERLLKHEYANKVTIHKSPWVNQYWVIAKSLSGKIVDWFLTKRIEHDTLQTIIHQTRKELSA